MGIIGLVVGLAVPAFARFAQNVRLKSTAREVMGLVSLARSLAIGSHQDRTVSLDLEQGLLRVFDEQGEPLEQQVRIPPSITVELQIGGTPANDSSFVFRPTGSLAGRSASLVLSGQQKRFVVMVSAATGAVTLNDESLSSDHDASR